jgi:molecular chaperone DnaJ
MAGSREALIITTGLYEDPALRRLRAPAQDATGLSRVLADPSIGGFHVTQLIDQTARTISREAQLFFANVASMMYCYCISHAMA